MSAESHVWDNSVTNSQLHKKKPQFWAGGELNDQADCVIPAGSPRCQWEASVMPEWEH